MNLPNVLDRKTLAALAAPNETHAVRVILLKVNNSAPARHRCRMRQYIFERDGFLCAHVLEIPMTLWMAGQHPGAYRDNPSISHDLQPTLGAPLVIQVIPWGDAKSLIAEIEESAPEPQPDFVPVLSELLSKLDAPPVMREALELIRGRDIKAFRDFVDSIKIEDDPDKGTAGPAAKNVEAPSPPSPAAAPTDTARRMREYRARKKAAAKKTAKKKA